MNTVSERVKTVLSRVFNVGEEVVNENSSPDTIEKWDSMGHLNLAVALEEEFKTELSEEEIMELMNFKLIVLMLKEKTGLQ